MVIIFGKNTIASDQGTTLHSWLGTATRADFWVPMPCGSLPFLGSSLASGSSCGTCPSCPSPRLPVRCSIRCMFFISITAAVFSGNQTSSFRVLSSDQAGLDQRSLNFLAWSSNVWGKDRQGRVTEHGLPRASAGMSSAGSCLSLCP